MRLYTVTTSGIVSKNRFEKFYRLEAPLVEIKVGQVLKNSAIIQAFLIHSNYAHNLENNKPLSSKISEECILNIVVMDRHSLIILNKLLNLKDNSAPSLSLDGLRPYYKYTVNSQVIFGFFLTNLKFFLKNFKDKDKLKLVNISFYTYTTKKPFTDIKFKLLKKFFLFET